MKQPVFCKNCTWSEPDKTSSWQLRCVEPNVNSQDNWALGSAIINGVSCTEARKPGWFMACGIKGKKYSHNGNFDLK